MAVPVDNTAKLHHDVWFLPEFESRVARDQTPKPSARPAHHTHDVVVEFPSSNAAVKMVKILLLATENVEHEHILMVPLADWVKWSRSTENRIIVTVPFQTYTTQNGKRHSVRVRNAAQLEQSSENSTRSAKRHCGGQAADQQRRVSLGNLEDLKKELHQHRIMFTTD